jgi:branched-subunit amino acid aminotransferase/4-amino-4-deoxychorismate lyase
LATFEGIEWAPYQISYTLAKKTVKLYPANAKTYSISRSIHYALFLVFEGLRFYVKKDGRNFTLVFLNPDLNANRFREGMSFSLTPEQQEFVPSQEEIMELFFKYLQSPKMLPFLRMMARDKSQGYLRPYTFDDAQSIGVSYPNNPVIRVVASRYRAYLGEPFHGVVIPYIVRAVSVNGTGRLKLGNNYPLSIRAVAEAKKIMPNAGAALFLDDRPYDRLEDRKVTEWDSSCCLIALKSGSVIRIPDSELILSSVTMHGLTRILQEDSVCVETRDIKYGELVDLVNRKEIVTVCSVGTAGILNRCSSLVLIDNDRNRLATMQSDTSDPLFQKLENAKKYYWEIFRGNVKVPTGLNRVEYTVNG